MSLPVTSGVTHEIWWESWLLPGCKPDEILGTIQAVHWGLKRGQGPTGRRVIIGRMVTHRYVWKTMTHRLPQFNFEILTSVTSGYLGHTLSIRPWNSAPFQEDQHEGGPSYSMMPTHT